MKFTKSLIKGKLVKRYKRFFADIKLNEETIIAHCPNTGSMMGLLDEENEVFVSKNNDPKRKLKYTLEIIKVKKNLVGVNTHFANKIAFHGLSNNLIKEVKNSNNIKPEVFFDK
jgi:sugar fermentation stimulation protein A